MLARWLVAVGWLMGVIFAFPGVNEAIAAGMDKISLQGWLIKTFNENGYYLPGAFLLE